VLVRMRMGMFITEAMINQRGQNAQFEDVTADLREALSLSGGRARQSRPYQRRPHVGQIIRPSRWAEKTNTATVARAHQSQPPADRPSDQAYRCDCWVKVKPPEVPFFLHRRAFTQPPR
jgi:hypothetical protein